MNLDYTKHGKPVGTVTFLVLKAVSVAEQDGSMKGFVMTGENMDGETVRIAIPIEQMGILYESIQEIRMRLPELI